MRKLFAVLFSLFASAANAQSYTTLQWGLDKTATPYNFGANIGGAWSNLGTVSSAGVWKVPSSNLSFTQTGTGAVARTVDAKLKQIVNIEDFGADPTGVNLSDTAFSNAIANGREIVLQCGGVYKISAAINWNASFAKLTGCSWQNTVIQQTTLSADIIDVTGSGNIIEGVEFYYASAASAGYGIKSIGANNIYKNFEVLNAYDGVLVSTGGGQFFHDFQILSSVHTGFLLSAVNDVFISDFIINCGNLTNCSLGAVRLADQTEAIVMSRGDVLLGKYSLTMDATSYSQSSRPAYNRFTDVYFDSAAQGSVINNAIETEFVGGWFSGGRTATGYAGLTIQQANSLTFTGTEFFNSGCNGVLLANTNAHNISFVGSSFQSNSVTSGSGTCHGLAVAAGVSDWSVTDGSAGNGLYTGGQQGYGVFVNSGASNNYTISGIKCSSNVTGGISDNGTGTSKAIIAPACGAPATLPATAIGPNGSISAAASSWDLEIGHNQNASTLFGAINGTSGASARIDFEVIGGTANSFADWALVDNSGSPTYSLTLGSGVTAFNLPATSFQSNVSSTLGYLAKGTYSGSYTDGTVVDYATGNGRISVGSSDTLSFYNGGIANTLLGQFSTAGDWSTTGKITSGGVVTPKTYTIAGLPACGSTLLGAIASVSNGTAYATGTYGSAVSATGAVTRPVVCTNTAGATTYAWAYN